MKTEKEFRVCWIQQKQSLRGTLQPYRSTSGNKKNLKQPKFTSKGTGKRTNGSQNQQMEKNKDQKN